MPKIVQAVLFASWHACWLPAGESGKFGKFNWWQFKAGLQVAVAGFPQRLRLPLLQAAWLSEQCPLPQKPPAPGMPPLFKQSRAETQAA